MSQPSIPSLRLVLFTSRPPGMVNTLVETFEALGHQVLLVVTARGTKKYPNPAYKSIVASSNANLDILVTSHMKRVPAMLRELAPDLIYSASFPLRFPPELLALPRLGCVNAHPSLLPKYRGLNPLFWQFIHNETHTGLTIHRMDADFDAGPILVQRELAIAPDDDAKSLWGKIARLEVSMLPETLAAVVSGALGRPQSITEASYAPLCSAIDRQLDWTRPATHLHNQIRGLAWLGALALIDGQIMLVRSARVVESSHALASATPGKLLACSPDGMLIQTGRDALLITEYAGVSQ